MVRYKWIHIVLVLGIVVLEVTKEKKKERTPYRYGSMKKKMREKKSKNTDDPLVLLRFMPKLAIARDFKWILRNHNHYRVSIPCGQCLPWYFWTVHIVTHIERN